MMSTPDEEEINKQVRLAHGVGLKGLFRIYDPFNSLVKSKIFILSFLFSAVYALTNYYFLMKTDVVAIKELTAIGMAILPSIAGFNLAAYSLALTLILGNSKLLASVIDLSNIVAKKEKGTFYQQISSSFAWSVLVQAMSIFIFYIVQIFIPIEINATEHTVKVFNSIVIFILVLISNYSILLVCQVVLNLFTFSQNLHFEATVQSLKDEVNDHSKENG